MYGPLYKIRRLGQDHNIELAVPCRIAKFRKIHKFVHFIERQKWVGLYGASRAGAYAIKSKARKRN